jgi:hypothetical protein
MSFNIFDRAAIQEYASRIKVLLAPPSSQAPTGEAQSSTLGDVDAREGSATTRSVAEVSASSSTNMDTESHSDDLLPIKTYEPIEMAPEDVQVYSRSPTHQVHKFRVIPTGQLIPQYFDSPIARWHDSAAARYLRGLEISNNGALQLPLAFETREKYVDRQRQLRPSLPLGLFNDEYRAWSQCRSTLGSFVPPQLSDPNKNRVKTSINYIPPFPQYAVVNVSVHQTSLRTLFRGLETPMGVMDPSYVDPLWVQLTQAQREDIEQTMVSNYRDHAWVTAAGEFNAPSLWRSGKEKMHVLLTLNSDWYGRYVWARYKAPRDLRMLPHEPRSDFIERQVFYRHQGSFDADTRHGLSFEYNQWLQHPDNHHMLPKNDEGETASDNFLLWRQRQSLAKWTSKKQTLDSTRS